MDKVKIYGEICGREFTLYTGNEYRFAVKTATRTYIFQGVLIGTTKINEEDKEDNAFLIKDGNMKHYLPFEEVVSIGDLKN